MVISTIQSLRTALKTFPAVSAVHPFLDDGDPPAPVRVAIRIPHGDSGATDTSVTDGTIHAELYVRSIPKPKHSETPHSQSRPTLFTSENPTHSEIPHILCSYTNALDPLLFAADEQNFSAFEFDLSLRNDPAYDIYVELFLLPSRQSSSTDGLSEDTASLQHLGYVRTTLDALRVSDKERVNVPLIAPQDNEKQLIRSAELQLEWHRPPGDLLVFEIRVKIDDLGGWPFSTRRPFFIIHRWEPDIRTWTAFYRSEVLTASTPGPNADGCMVFGLSVQTVRKIVGLNDARPLRFEFFHYKISCEPRILGYAFTSLLKLRQMEVGTNLHLELKSYPQGELQGTLSLQESRITKSRYFFSLLAHFGGPVKGKLIYVVVTITDPADLEPRDGASSMSKRASRLWRRRQGRPLFSLSKYGDGGIWEDIYCSEVPSYSRLHRLYQFNIAKISVRKMHGGNPSRPLRINVHRHYGQYHTPLQSSLLTNFSNLLEAEHGKVYVLAIDEYAAQDHGRDWKTKCGYIRIDHSEDSPTSTLLSLHCVLDTLPPAGALEAPAMGN